MTSLKRRPYCLCLLSTTCPKANGKGELTMVKKYKNGNAKAHHGEPETHDGREAHDGHTPRELTWKKKCWRWVSPPWALSPSWLASGKPTPSFYEGWLHASLLCFSSVSLAFSLGSLV